MGQKRRRLSKSAEFDRVYRQGRSAGGRFLVLYAFGRPENAAEAADRQGPRLGVSVGRRVGGAVERNEVKRLLREAFWSLGEALPDDHDYVIVARPDCGGLVGRERLAGITRELGELSEKLGFGASRSGEQS